MANERLKINAAWILGVILGVRIREAYDGRGGG